MAQITIRGIDPEVEKEIRKISKEQGKSINWVIQDLIHKHPRFDRKRKKYPADSLRRLAGSWSETEASDFMDAIQSCKQIDDELWK